MGDAKMVDKCLLYEEPQQVMVCLLLVKKLTMIEVTLMANTDIN